MHVSHAAIINKLHVIVNMINVSVNKALGFPVFPDLMNNQLKQ